MVDVEHPAPTVREYRNATLSRFACDRAEGERMRHIRGAVYHRGRLVPESLRVGGASGDAVVAEDPERMEPDPAEPWRLPGRWLYGGHWMDHWGHFLTETLTSLWPEPDPKVDGLVFHRFIFDHNIRLWQSDLLVRGAYDLPVVVVTERHPCQVERLVLPSRTLVTNTYVAPEALRVWDRIAGHQPMGDKPVFLSRTRLDANHPRRIPGDEDLDDLMAGLGMTVVHPQELRAGTQVNLAAGAPVIVGVAGSQLHLSMFAPSSTHVIEIGDSRSSHVPLPNQRLIDDLRKHRSDFVPFIPTPDGGRDAKATAEAVSALLG